MHLLNIYF